MPVNDELLERVLRFREHCGAICAEARQMVLTNRALMRIPDHARRSRLTEVNGSVPEDRSEEIAAVFARRPDELLDLIRTDIDMAATFAKMTQQTFDPVRKHRLVRNAFLAYEAALRLKTRIALPADQKRELDAQLQELQSRLYALAKNSGTNRSLSRTDK